ncbi:zinc finger protein ZAT5-like [Solanum tuberosum]|uniref:zinc finger protein ZAT5-like n=1 Tax=Solanum tuberosum TaxID=4113 RepID=UPI00073A4E0D|nr:PREDICTED: zinc finger protein ZAT5-like [Solanum tuberosum]KAH0673536.1 hypothetical protein KY284_024623 [Solanum tuberosum]
MEAPQEEVMGGVSKGKRTKRVRPQSLITFMTINNAHSSSTGDANVDGTVNGEEVNDDDDNNNNDSSPPPTTSDENIPDDDVPTEEEEETAKCLILLSQGGHHHHHRRHQTPPKKFFDLFNDDMGLYQTKFNSKRYVETTDLGNGAKAGTYVYECKTCNRTFSSFQALGGHRASHKKPKPLTIEPKKHPFFYFSDQDESSPPTTTTTNYKYNNKLSPTLSPLSSQFNNINMESTPNYNKSPSPRIHTCSYCGAEFTSGQALGGHMRRHRGGANTNNTILCLSPLSIDQEYANYNLKKPRNGLSLDLNLPAPQDYQNQSRNLQHPPKYPQEQAQKQQQEQEQEQQQTTLVLSTTPQLIDCHY